MDNQNNEKEQFIHYTSIENHYSNYVDEMRSRYPDLEKQLFVVQQKYDGSNFQLIFSRNEPVKYGSRNKLLSENDKFFGYKKILPRLEDIRNKVQNFLINSEYQSINLFGELYGKAVIDRIQYDTDSELAIKFFDVYFDNVIQSPKDFSGWTEAIGIPKEFIVEHMTEHPVTLNEALSFDLNSVKTRCDDIIEGVVIKLNTFIPKSNQCKDESQDTGDLFQFVIKLKNSKYVEREHAPVKASTKNATKKSEESDEALSLIQREFKCYINQNRLLNSYAKQEWKKQEIKQFVEFVLDDALQDFLKDVYSNKFNNILPEGDLKKLREFKDTKDFKNIKKQLELPAKKTQAQTFTMAKQMFQ